MRLSIGRIAFVLAGASCAIASGPSVACTFSPPDYADVEPRAARDAEPVPPAPAIRLEGVRRGNGEKPLLSCSDIGVISLSIPDDAGAATTIVLFEVIASTAAEAIVDERPMRAGAPIDGRRYFVFSWIDGADDKQEPLHVRIRATALSETGARGGSATIRVDEPGS